MMPDNNQSQLGAKSLPQRLTLYLGGVAYSALGVVFIVGAGLGAQPTQTLNYVLTLVTGLSLGTWTFLMLSLYAIIQVPLRGQGFGWLQPIQIAMALFMGILVDLWRALLIDVTFPGGYFGQLLELALGIFILASGMVIYRSARIADLPFDGLCAAVGTRFLGGAFHRGRMFMDATLVVAALVISLVFLGSIHGVREGTVIAALMIGRCVPYTRRIVVPILEKLGFQAIE
ncbi:MAG: DUF6198 family protein [Oscillospiraceae bacterium]|nr:DUF6198 family protein [Oscillospiraceae bacterium]